MKRKLFHLLTVIIIMANLSSIASAATILGWNNLGMHCMDSSYSEFSILPPYNTIEAQLIVNGSLVKSSTGYSLTYEAIADPSGSINKSSVGKSNWLDYAPILYGKYLANADEGLSSWNMPGPANLPQSMLFETMNLPAPGASALVNWFRAEGIPLTPYDDGGQKNYYPMFRLTARDSTNAVIAQSDIVLPVSDEMDCRVCHGANTLAAAAPASGWITDPIPGREYRLNILKLHDEKQFASHPALYADALSAKGLNALGLYPTVAAGRPVLCASCHASEALGAPSYSSSNGTVPQLTTSIHSKHAGVIDPLTHVSMDSASNRSACYRCHPGSSTKCLRGAMGAAVANDGTMEMQCQNCHGSMSQVGSSSRTGWFMEPKCQSCHTGTATTNNGQIRYTTVFETNGQERIATDPTFATSTDTPAAGLSLYRFSTGHGGLQCSACHGSTHAEFPSSHSNDNLRNIQLQGHAGVMIECASCHTTSVPTNPNGGPHGMHPVGQSWVSAHQSAVGQVGRADCQKCHGIDYRGTPLSRVQGPRTLSAGGTQNFYRGATIGCYTCHQGPSRDNMNASPAPSVANISAWTLPGKSVVINLPAVTAGVVLRVISPAQNGAVGFANGVATYYPNDGFAGVDTFTFAGYDGAKNSPLATGTITVSANQPPVGQAPGISAAPISQAIVAGRSTTLSVSVTGTAPFTYQWYKNGAVIAGATNAILTLSNVTTTATGTYYVHVSNSYGAVNSANAVITVGSATSKTLPSITSLAPASGKVGDNVIINGSAFTGVTVVKFNNTSSSFTVSSDRKITTRVPTGATTGAITLVSPNGVKTSTQVFTVKPAPGIVSITPSRGPVGTKVTIYGQNFTERPRVYFNDAPAARVERVSGTIVATVPVKATTGPVEVVTEGGVALAASIFTVTTPPIITSFAPSYGKLGDTITINGSAFTGTTSVSFNGTAATFAVVTDKKITATIPADATSGKITVSNTDGTTASSRSFTIKPLPTVASISISSGPIGSKLSITGSNFISPIKVTFNGVSAVQISCKSSTLLEVTVPLLSTSGRVVVSTGGGSAIMTPLYTITHPPVLSSFSPLYGRAGSTVTFNGSSLTGSTSVSFNGIHATTFAVVSDKILTAVVPAGATSGKITVSNADGATTSPRIFAVTTDIRH